MSTANRLSAAESILGILTDSIQPPKGPAVDPCSHILHARIEELIQRLTTTACPDEKALAICELTAVESDKFPLPPAVVVHIGEAVNDEDAVVRLNAVASLGVLSGGSHYVDFVRATLSDSDSLVREAAVVAVGNFGEIGTAAVWQLQARLSDPDSYVVEATLATLGELQLVPVVLEQVIPFLNCPLWTTQRAALGAVATLGQTARALPDLIHQLSDLTAHPTWSVAEAARSALHAIDIDNATNKSHSARRALVDFPSQPTQAEYNELWACQLEETEVASKKKQQRRRSSAGEVVDGMNASTTVGTTSMDIMTAQHGGDSEQSASESAIPHRPPRRSIRHPTGGGVISGRVRAAGKFC